MRNLLRRFFHEPASTASLIPAINQRRAELSTLTDEDLKAAGRNAREMIDVMAVTAVAGARVLGLNMFDVQLQGALAMAAGKIAEMQTGEGKTFAATPAVAWFAKAGQGV